MYRVTLNGTDVYNKIIKFQLRETRNYQRLILWSADGVKHDFKLSALNEINIERAIK